VKYAIIVHRESRTVPAHFPGRPLPYYFVEVLDCGGEGRRLFWVGLQLGRRGGYHKVQRAQRVLTEVDSISLIALRKIDYIETALRVANNHISHMSTSGEIHRYWYHGGSYICAGRSPINNKENRMIKPSLVISALLLLSASVANADTPPAAPGAASEHSQDADKGRANAEEKREKSMDKRSKKEEREGRKEDKRDRKEGRKEHGDKEHGDKSEHADHHEHAERPAKSERSER
jgi:hypothetical protein